MRPRVPEVEVSDVPARLPDDLVLLDVREDDEWAAGHAPGALHIPLHQVPRRLAEIPADARVLVICRVGGRSAQAAAYLQAHGVEAVNVAGGMQAWQGAQRPMVADTGGPPDVI